MSATIVWFRQDLRLRDNLALHAAARRGGPVIPVYIWSPQEEGDWPPGAASRWWLNQSLRALDATLREHGSRLILARGPTADTLLKIAATCAATAVYWNRRYEPAALECGERVNEKLGAVGIEARVFHSSLLVEPDALLNQSGKPYRVYSAFRRRVLRDFHPAQIVNRNAKVPAPRSWPRSVSLRSLRLLPDVKWYAHMARAWKPGEAGAHAALRRFVRDGLKDYAAGRDHPGRRGTSRLSPHLHFGEIGPRQVWQALGARGRASPFLNELVWREFAHHLLFHFPYTTQSPLREEFARFPWRRKPRLLRAWQGGCTGVPLVDAGMRELWATGWMHNRVRMVAASFLVKNLMTPWQDGARWFWDTLVDADLANNTMNWQWVAGSGADAAPYFRIFNPITQAKRFDADGAYVRKWAAGSSSCRPIVDLRASREAALEAFHAMRG